MSTDQTETDDEPFTDFDWEEFCKHRGLEPGQSVSQEAIMAALRQSDQVEVSPLTALGLLDIGVEEGVFEAVGLYEYQVCDGVHFEEGESCQD